MEILDPHKCGTCIFRELDGKCMVQGTYKESSELCHEHRNFLCKECHAILKVVKRFLDDENGLEYLLLELLCTECGFTRKARAKIP